MPNPEIEVPKTPFSNANALAKLPPRPPALRGSVLDPMPSQANTFSSSSQGLNPEWLRKKSSYKREMSRKCELSGYTEDITKAELSRDNSGEIINEAVSVEKTGGLDHPFLAPMWCRISDSSFRRELLLHAHTDVAGNWLQMLVSLLVEPLSFA